MNPPNLKLFEYRPTMPPICKFANLPAFSDWSKALVFNKQNGSSLIMAKWKCSKCKCWHYIIAPPAPAGATSGNVREYVIPKHIQILISDAKD